MNIVLTQHRLIVKNILNVKLQFGRGAFTIASQADREVSSEDIISFFGEGIQFIRNFRTGCYGSIQIDWRISLTAYENQLCIQEQHLVLRRVSNFEFLTPDKIRYIV